MTSPTIGIYNRKKDHHQCIQDYLERISLSVGDEGKNPQKQAIDNYVQSQIEHAIREAIEVGKGMKKTEKYIENGRDLNEVYNQAISDYQSNLSSLIGE